MPPAPGPDPARTAAVCGGARDGTRTDCAVGSGEWAEPPHYPWTFRRRSKKKGHFSAFFDPFLGRGRSCFEAALGPEEGPEAELGKPIPTWGPPGTARVPQAVGVYGPGLTESGHGQPGRVPARLASRGVWQSLP